MFTRFFFIPLLFSLFISATAQPTWQVVNTSNLYVKEFGFRSPNEIYAAGLNGMAKSTNLGLNWTPVFPDSEAASVGITNAGTLLVGFYDYQVFHIRRSTDNGQSWPSVFTSDFPIHRFHVAPNGDIFVTNWDRVLRSTNDGQSWTNISTNWNINVRDVLPLSNNILLVASDSAVFSMGYAGGSLGMPLCAPYVWMLARAPIGYIYASTSTGLYRSTNSGQDWTLSLGQGEFSHVITDHQNRVYAYNTWTTLLYYTENHGLSWDSTISNTLPLSEIYHLQSIGYDPYNGYVYCYVGENIYRTTVPMVGVDERLQTQLPTTFDAQSYPNPMNANTMLTMTIPTSGHYTISIYSTQGALLSKATQSFYSGGTYRIPISFEKFSSGTYYIHIGNKNSTQKVLPVVLLK